MRAWGSGLSWAALAFVVAGCGIATGPVPAVCARASDCTAGTTCIAQACVASTACASSRTCPDLVCSTTRGVCVECNTRVDCPGGDACSEGVCLARPACRSDRDCSAMGLVCDVTAMGCVECNADSDCAPPERCGPDHACGSSVRDAGMDSSSAADGSVDASSDARIEASIDARVARDVGMDAAVETDAFVTRDDASFEDVGHDAPLAFDADIDAACPAGLAYCAGLCVDTASDPQNCGTCGNSCGPGGTCVATGCLCATGATLCGARCADVTRDHESCGACGHACAANERCVMSACVVSPLYHGWTSPLAGCSTTTYDSTAPTALGGSYPFNAGDANACRAWKLAATVCTTEPMMYIDAYNWTCPISGGFTDPVFGAYCLAPSPQYACSTCPGACNAMCIHSPLSLRNCMGMEIPQL